jgi:UDP-3-O-[3-hydroxymyristoyl] glucosamine N-acyltransferase
MVDKRFFVRNSAQNLAKLAEISGAKLYNPDDADYIIDDVAPLDRAGDHEISFLDNSKYVDLFSHTKSAACIIREKFVEVAPAGARLLIATDPYRSYALIAQYFYPYTPLISNISPHSFIDETAILGENCNVASGAFIGKNVVIGRGAIIGANAVLHDGVVLGDDVRVGGLSSVSHAIIGDRVIIHRGVHIGQDGFGFSLGRDGHVKVPQLGRVLIGDDVEIGASTCIDRGTGPDTIIGDGAKIDNLVQIAHNVQIGKNTVIAAQCGIAGSTKIGDGVVMGGQVGIAGHLRIGSGVKIAAQAGVLNDLQAGGAYGGTPAVAIKDWHRQSVLLQKLIRKQFSENNIKEEVQEGERND